MKAFIIRQSDGSFADLVIRADSAQRASEFAMGDGEPEEIREDAANAMGVPDRPGRHGEALSRWLIGAPAESLP